MARWSPKYVLVMLLAVFLTAGFSLSAAQASVMSVKMASGMTMPSDAGMSGMGTAGDCSACLKGAGDTGNPMHCPPTCIAPAFAMLPQNLAVMMVPPAQQPSPLPTPFLHGRSTLPEPSPPRPSALV
ncbi:hypothetical protein [Mesorhizobium sp. STM 4661]|uniref:hypothetical protein n=1 Tax=Mesorhizobium sp. STM 4661 TaxID=1297570 RepID=UPI0002BDE21D|nr:hypothetical protein [Mesorhizobium sp. STM 4661]CCV11943.1 conserved exported hypothetical protein [Mesorhizobium sp. STM 4661]